MRRWCHHLTRRNNCACIASVVAGLPCLQADHYDKDERYMAINDLNAELGKAAVKIDAGLEKKICDTVLKRLESDTCNDVQALAVKW